MSIALASASLDELERRTILRFVELLDDRLGAGLVAVWLYGSRARGEAPHPESDVDLMVVVRGGDADADAVEDALFDAAAEQGSNAHRFSTQIVTPTWLVERRAIKSFFIGEVDRDKIILRGEP
ncbi:MAG: nucleotidyltransferase family protein [Solirubrobacterales bacterium]